jgi:hypothetical protein
LSLFTKLSLTQSGSRGDRFSSDCHRRLRRLSSSEAIIDSVDPRMLLLASTVAGLSLLASACGGSSSPHMSAQSTQQNAALAFARCMRSHGVPNFPDPDSQGNFVQFHVHVSKQASSAADDACKHLLLRGSGTATPQQQQQKFTFALKVAHCLRAHGFPNFPDPSVSSQGASENLSAAKIDANSPQFQAAETTCEKQERKALGLP